MKTMTQSYEDLYWINLDIYKNMSLEELREEIKKYPDFSFSEAQKLKVLKEELEKEKDHEKFKLLTKKVHLQLFKRARDFYRDEAIDPLFEQYDKDNAMRSIKAHLVVRELKKEV